MSQNVIHKTWTMESQLLDTEAQTKATTGWLKTPGLQSGEMKVTFTYKHLLQVFFSNIAD